MAYQSTLFDDNTPTGRRPFRRFKMMEGPVVNNLGTGLFAHSLAKKKKKRMNKNDSITNNRGNVRIT
jgi:hypothetical protein